MKARKYWVTLGISASTTVIVEAVSKDAAIEKALNEA